MSDPDRSQVLETDRDRPYVAKVALAAALSMIATGAAAWLVFGQDKVSRSEMESFVSQQILVQDARLGGKINQNADALSKLEANVNAIVSLQQELLVEQRILVTKFDAMLRERTEGR